MTRHVYGSLAALRGWLLTGDRTYIDERAKVWGQIDETKKTLDALSENWTNPDNIIKWERFKRVLENFSIQQKTVEETVGTPDEFPATTMLLNEAIPRATIMSDHISKMIDLEVVHHNTKEGDRFVILSILAGVRGSLGLGLADIRAYLLTGKEEFKELYNLQWAQNDLYFKQLFNSMALLSPEQKQAFAIFQENRREFILLPPKMFKIRASNQWNLPTYLLISEAAPLAHQLIDILEGSLGSNVNTEEGLMGNQQKLLIEDLLVNIQLIDDLDSIQWTLLFVSLFLGAVAAILLERSISVPIIEMTSAMKSLAEDNPNIYVPNRQRTDEIGAMARAVQHFKESANKRIKLEKELDFQKFALDKHAIVSITDVKGNITFANEKFCQISGYSIDELIDKNHRILKSDEHDVDFYKDLWATISKGKVWNGEIKNTRKDGSTYWVMSSISPFLNDKGKPFQYISIRTDITKTKIAEQQAEIANQTKSNLLANMSHELRTPLNAIIGFSSVMKDQMFGPIENNKYLDYSKDINMSGEHLLSLINDILDISAIEAGAVELIEENIDLNSILTDVIRMSEVQANLAGVIINFTKNEENYDVFADARRVKQIFINLITNALKFTQKGGTVFISTDLNKDGSYRIDVRDTGIGMTEDDIEKAMTTFGQVLSVDTNGHEGTGLGLPLTQGLMALHDGSLDIASKINSGTTITVAFPKERVIHRASTV
jgi:PAS domain S-box-containing protein